MEVRAERMVTEEMKRVGWKERDILGRPKSDPGKVRLALELRANTTRPVSWIAQRLSMGSRGHVTRLLHRLGKKTNDSQCDNVVN